MIFQALKKAKLQKELKENTDVSLMTESIYSSMVGTAILSKVDKKQTIENKTLDHYLSMFN